MVSKLIKNGDAYICSNCKMRQPHFRVNCFFCGNWFSNFESLLIEETEEKENGTIQQKTENRITNSSGKN